MRGMTELTLTIKLDMKGW